MLTNPAITQDYVTKVIQELTSYPFHVFDTVFIGGGTPTALNEAEWLPLLKVLSTRITPQTEFTVECNFESTTEAKLHLLKHYGVNRLSFGVQTFDEQALLSLNRHHSAQDVVSGIALAKSVGFNHINIDLIYDLPSVSDAQLERDLDSFLALDVDHISTYALTVHPGTVFGIRKVKQATDDVSRAHYETIYHKLTHHGYERYEVSNFARNQAYSRHNMTYWKDENYLGIGLGASGYLHPRRYTNTKSMKRYLAGQWNDQEETLTPRMEMFEFLMLNLRLKDGFLFTSFSQRFQENFVDSFQESLPTLQEKKLLVLTKTSCYATFEGMLLLDYVVIQLTKHKI
jgi:oxygen-independent coproporphyrinogen-3 oxidase